MEGNHEDKDVSKLLLKLMEGYSDAAIAPLSEFSPSKEITINAEAASCSRKRKPSPQIERDRRVQMSGLYATLQSMIPNLLHKATRVKIIEETIAYIKELEECLEELKRRKAAAIRALRLCNHPNASSSVDVTVSGNVAFFEVSAMVRRGLVKEIFGVFDKHRVEVLAAGVAVHELELRLTVTALIDGNGDDVGAAERIKTDLLTLLF
uniref:BHLH domain-containing protein n=1 Tax=Nelumbo nucifera TaxID=4432 RepID=A0A822YMY2_NELNU|nr:TPA_asm: hypothetical protein HUJ06_012284 [Nelumbo nucifera]